MLNAYRLKHLVTTLVLVISSVSLHGQSASDLRIANVRFSEETPQFGGERWLEMEVLLDVQGNSNRAAPNPDFIDRVHIQVGLANNIGNPSNPALEYYWTRVEAPTLERGTHRFRFYLSPEQIRRGRMGGGEPYAWYVQVDVGNPGASNPQMQSIFAVSRTLRELPRLERFKELLEDQKEARAGILLPQVETPFRDMYADNTPMVKGYNRDN